MRKKTLEEIQKIIDLYNAGFIIDEIAIKLDCSVVTIKKYLNEYNIPRLRGKFKPVIKNAFNEITDDGAYWLGFIAADGHIRDTIYHGHRDVNFSVEINEKDLDHLSQLKNFVGDGNIYKRGREDGCYIYACRRQYIVNNLSKWLPVNNKTETIVIPPHISDVHKNHFLRGYIDGDGHITSSGSIQITSCPQMLDSIKNFIGLPYRQNFKKNNKASTICYRKKESLEIYSKVFGDSKLRLDRKWSKIK